MTDKPPATGEEVIQHFLLITAERGWSNLLGVNWCTDAGRPSVWDVPGTDSYINGVPIVLDQDFYMGFVLEVVDRESSRVRYAALSTFHGHGEDEDGNIEWDHSATWFPEDIGIFFERKQKKAELYQWGVQEILAMNADYAKNR